MNVSNRKERIQKRNEQKSKNEKSEEYFFKKIAIIKQRTICFFSLS